MLDWILDMKSVREFDVAIIGTFFSLEFTEYLAPMCIYSGESDTNLREWSKFSQITGNSWSHHWRLRQLLGVYQYLVLKNIQLSPVRHSKIIEKLCTPLNCLHCSEERPDDVLDQGADEGVRFWLQRLHERQRARRVRQVQLEAGRAGLQQGHQPYERRWANAEL